MSDGIIGYGATLTFCATTSFTTVTTVGNITGITGPGQARDSVDYSTMDSTSKWREKLPGMLDAGEVTVEMNYDGAAAGTANDLNTEFTNVTQYWRITFNDHTTAASRSNWTCAGFMTGLSFAAPFDDKVTQPVVITCTGKPTYTDVAG